MKKFLVGLLMFTTVLLSPSTVYGGTMLRYGVGILGSAEYGTTETKIFSVGYEEDILGIFITQWELGLFTDQGGHGRSSSGFGNVSLGVEVNPGYFVLRSLWGIGGITTPDSMLGGLFEFNQDLFLGVRDDKNKMIGLNYKHISSAGIYSPNHGRDFITVQVEVPW